MIKHLRNRGLNLFAISIIAALFLFITSLLFLEKGKSLETDLFSEIIKTAPGLSYRTQTDINSSANSYSSFSLAIFLLQIIVIIFAARILGIFFRKINQPSVVGEIFAGILLGPSLFGHFFPDTFHFLFNEQSLHILFFLSEIGLILYMFIIGMELDWDHARSGAKTSAGISFFSMALPFSSGIVLSYFLYNRIFVHNNVRFLIFALFTGISLSVTAFPVLARILQERSLSRVKIGTIALTSAAIGDLVAWSLLAVIVALAKAQSAKDAVFTISSALLFIGFMLYAVRPVLKKVSSIYSTKESLTKSVIAGIFIYLFVSSLTTEIIGIHALFGAFLAGAIIPADKPIKSILIDKIEDLSVVIFLPLFFAYSGLRTQLGFLYSPYILFICIIVIATASAGKFLGSFIPARLSGLSWKESASIGILMNTKGLMELIVLNIGYDIGIISPEMFLILFMMAVVTTFMTGPGISLIEKFNLLLSAPAAETEVGPSVLLAFAKRDTALNLVRTASLLFGNINIAGIHINRNDIMTESSAVKKIEKTMSAIRNEAESLKLNLKTHYRFTDNIESEIAEYAKSINAGILLMGAGRDIFSSNILRGRIKKIMKKTSCNTGILIGKNKINPTSYCILKASGKDMRIENFMRKYQFSEKADIKTVSLEKFAKQVSGRKIHEENSSSRQFNKDVLYLIDIKSWENLYEIGADTGNYSYLILNLKNRTNKSATFSQR